MQTPEHWTHKLGMTTEALFVTDDSGRIQYWNEGAQRLTGYPAAEVLGKRCYSVLRGRHAGRVWCQADCRVRRSVRRGELPSHVCLDVQSSDGRSVPVAVSFIVQKERDGQVIAHLLEDASRQDELRETLRGVLRLLQDLGAHRSAAALPNEPSPAPGRRAAVDLSILTRREIDALRFLKDGLSTDAIATQLGVSRFTARNHIQHALRKLGLHTRSQAVAAAFEQGLR
jgi:PAS domain S-box-containing protein